MKLFLPFLLIFFHILLLISYRFTLWPEMVVYPYLLNNGFVLYKDIILPYTPLAIEFLAFIAKVAGYDVKTFQLLSWFLIIVTDLLIYIFSKSIFKSTKMAFVNLGFFVFFSIPFGVNTLWFDIIQAPLILCAIFFYFKYKSTGILKYLFVCFSFVALGLFIKQQVIWLAILLFLSLLVKDKRYKSILKKFIIACLPIIIGLSLFMIYLDTNNILNEGIFWSFSFPFLKSSKVPGYLAFASAKQFLVLVSFILFFLPMVLQKNNLGYLVMLSLPLIIFIFPRFDFFHLIPFLSVVSLFFYKNIKVAKKLPLGNLFIVLLFLPLVFSILYYKNNKTKEVRFFEEHIFTEAKAIENLTEKSVPIYVQNGPDQILPLSHRLPVKPWADEFSWYLELENVQEKIVASIESQGVKYVVFKPYEDGNIYDLGAYKPKKIYNYIESSYTTLLPISPYLWLKIKNEKDKL